MTTPPTANSATPTRSVDGVELPSSGRWKVDPGHAEVGFLGRHFMLAKVRGRFLDVDATVDIGERIEDSSITATIRTASVDSGDATRDDHLRSADLLDVDTHPTATFVSTRVVPHGSRATVSGELTIKGITQPIDLEVEFLGAVVDPWGNERAIFDASGRIDREDFGLTWNMVLDSGGLLVSREIDLVLHVELLRQT